MPFSYCFYLKFQFDINALKGIKVNLSKDTEDRVVSLKDDSNKSYRMQRELTHEMDNIYRPLVQDSITNDIVLGPQFKGVMTFTEVIGAFQPIDKELVQTLKVKLH